MPPHGDLDVLDLNRSQDINPLEDPEIQDLLEEFHRSQDTFDLSQDHFHLEEDGPETQSWADQSHPDDGSVSFDRWKASFLKRLDTILAEAPEESRVKALASYDKFSQQMDEFLRIVHHVQDCIHEGSISTTSVGVKGVRALNELKQGATDTMFALMDWMPTTVKEEQAVRYTKWQLGAVLVRKGFDVYETMLMAREMLDQAKEECVDKVADRQTLDAIAYYERQIVRFCDVMADLGLYELMMQAHVQLGEKRRQHKRNAVLKEGKANGGKVKPEENGNEKNSSSCCSNQEQECELLDAWEGSVSDVVLVNEPQPTEEEESVASEDVNAEGCQDENPSDNESEGCEEEEGEEEEDDEPQSEDEDEDAQRVGMAGDEENCLSTSGKDDDDDDDELQPSDGQGAERVENSEGGLHEEKTPLDAEEAGLEVNDKEPQTEVEGIQVAEEDGDAEGGQYHDGSLHNEEELMEDTDKKDKTHLYDEENQAEDEDHNAENCHPDEDKTFSGQAAEEDVNAESGNPDDDRSLPVKGKGGGNGSSRPHVRLQFGLPVLKTYNRKMKHDDCILVPELFGTEDDLSNYDNLRDEITQLRKRQIPNSMWRVTEDGTRVVCDNAVASSTVQMIVDKLVEYFRIEQECLTIEAEMYRDAKDTKPASHDIVAYKTGDEKAANIAITASFGAERDLALKAKEGGTPIHVPQRNNGIFTIGRDVNVRFVNSIIEGEDASSQGHICITVRGRVPNVVEEGGSPDPLEVNQEESLQ